MTPLPDPPEPLATADHADAPLPPEQESPVEIHAPDEPVHSWRQFFIHLAIVSIGLLIALGLEALVERHHHRLLVREARENIAREIAENRQQLQDNLKAIHADETRMTANLRLLAAFRDTGSLPAGNKLQYNLEWSRLADTAWSTARDTGALGHMPYAEVQCYAGIYAQQDIVNARALEVFRDQSRAIAPVLATGEPQRLTGTELDRVLQRSTDLLADLKGIGQVMSQWDPGCARAGKPE